MLGHCLSLQQGLSLKVCVGKDLRRSPRWQEALPCPSHPRAQRCQQLLLPAFFHPSRALERSSLVLPR